MNAKQNLIDQILDEVVRCCEVRIDGEVLVTRDDVIGRRRDDNVVMTRAIFVRMMMLAGYSRATTAAYLHRDTKTIGNILRSDNDFESRRAYAKAKAEATLKVIELL